MDVSPAQRANNNHKRRRRVSGQTVSSSLPGGVKIETLTADEDSFPALGSSVKSTKSKQVPLSAPKGATVRPRRQRGGRGAGENVNTTAQPADAPDGQDEEYTIRPAADRTAHELASSTPRIAGDHVVGVTPLPPRSPGQTKQGHGPGPPPSPHQPRNIAVNMQSLSLSQAVPKYSARPPSEFVAGQPSARLRYAGDQQQPSSPYGPLSRRQLAKSLQDPGLHQPQFRQPITHSPRALFTRQMGVLQSIADREVERVAIRPSELEAKEQFRLALLQVLRKALASDGSRPLSSNDLASVRLTCFGSTGSGFATKNSDMDLTLTLPTCKTSGDVSCSPVPVLLERTLLHAGYGARLLTNTRVPIIKVCEQPTSDLLAALRGDQPGTKDVKLSKDSMVTLDSIVHRLIQRIKNQPSVSLKGDITTVASLEESLLDQLDFFKQGPDDDLTHYYRRAKDLLHQMGGRDLSLHQTEALNDGQHYILDAVIRQFAGGLRDPQVRAMLLTHKPFELANVHNESARSLWAAWIYAEIHRLVQAYRRRTIIDTDRRRVQEAATLIQEWDLLGQQRCIDHTSLMRKLDKIHKRLTAIPSLQLCLLTQRADEDAKRYAQRARLLLCRTLGVDANDRSPVLENHFLGQVNCFLDLFMHSLSDDTIRKDLTARRPAGGWQSLDEFFANHAALSRLKGYRDGLARGLFDKSAAQAVAARLAVIDRSKVMLSTSRIHRILDELHSFPSPDGQHSYPSTFKHGRAAEFPKDGIGIQCDINFSNELAILNTRLLKCYSLCDPRVTSFVLFIKSWTKRRNINTPYHGTLSSYGYVLMALHFLMNVASPAVIPNLQLMHAERGVPPDPTLDTCNGYDTRFFRDENALRQMAAQCKLTQNKQTVGELLLGFFAYFAGERRQGSFGFDWGSAVLSLRTRGGLLTKQAKGWTAAKITYVDVPPSAPLLATGKPRNPLPDSNEPAAAGGDHTSAPPDALEDQQPQPPAKKGIRHRYLIAIEDPFELEHNVGRTVLHPGLIVIRDEFRRAWRIIQGLGMGTGEDELLAVAKGGVEGGEATEPKKGGSGVGGGGAS